MIVPEHLRKNWTLGSIVGSTLLMQVCCGLGGCASGRLTRADQDLAGAIPDYRASISATPAARSTETSTVSADPLPIPVDGATPDPVVVGDRMSPPRWTSQDREATPPLLAQQFSGTRPRGFVPPGQPRPPLAGHGGNGNHNPGQPPFGGPIGGPIIVPQIYGFPQPVGPADYIPPSPATLSGQIESLPVIVPQPRSRSRATFEVQPVDPAPNAGIIIDTQPPVPRSGYYELPPPPE